MQHTHTCYEKLKRHHYRLEHLNKTQLNSTQLYCDILAAEQLNSWIAEYSSIAYRL